MLEVEWLESEVSQSRDNKCCGHAASAASHDDWANFFAHNHLVLLTRSTEAPLTAMSGSDINKGVQFLHAYSNLELKNSIVNGATASTSEGQSDASTNGICLLTRQNTAKPQGTLLVELKKGKVYFKQKPISLEKQSETLQGALPTLLWP